MKAIIKVLMVLCWLPLIATAQIDPFSDIVDSLSPAAKASKYELVVPKEPKYKGWYFGARLGVVRSLTGFYIPYDEKTKLSATGGIIFPEFTERITTGALELNFNYVSSEYFTLNISNVNMLNYGYFSLYKDFIDLPYSTNYLQYYVSSLLVQPTLTKGSSRLNWFLGLGPGISITYGRSGSFDNKYVLSNYHFLIDLATGITYTNSNLSKLSLKFNFFSNSSLELTNFRTVIYGMGASVGYLLPISAFKRKSKTATDPDS
jgi:hypothetical protein